MMKTGRRAAGLVIVALLALSLLPLVVSAGSSPGIELRARLRVAVIVFDPSHRLLGDLANRTFSESFCAMLSQANPSVEIDLVTNITYLYAPSWALISLRQWLSRNYVEAPAPPWAESYAEKHSLVVKWVELRPFYEHLWSLVEETLSSRRLAVDDVVAIIGNIDNVSRQYFEKPPSYLNVTGIEGVRGWGGEKPLVFYDLSVIPRPWPPRFVPYSSLGVPLNAHTHPPVWSLREPSGYIRGLVESHIAFHYLSFDGQLSWYSRLFRVRVYVVDYGDENTTRQVLRSINTSLVRSLVESMDPFINVTVTVGRIGEGSPAYPVLQRLLSSAKLVNGWLVLNTSKIESMVTWLAREKIAPINGTPCIQVSSANTSTGATRYRLYHSQCDYIFLVLATPRPSYLTYQWMNATALSLLTPITTVGVGLSTFPGYAYRVLRGGLSRVIAHEAGHYLGLNHPFQTSSCDVTGINWLMDFIETPMSYYDEEIAYYRVGDVSPYNSFQTALFHIAALIASGKTSLNEAQRLLDKYNPQEALRIILSTAPAAPQGAKTPTTSTNSQKSPPSTSSTHTVTTKGRLNSPNNAATPLLTILGPVAITATAIMILYHRRKHS